MTELARLLAPAELDAADGSHGRMTVELSQAQLGRAIEIVVPRRLVCARCDGGGCDACGRSGALRLDGDDAARTTQLVLPRTATSPFRVRLARPLGEDAGVDRLTIEVRLSTPTSLPARGDEAKLAAVALALLGLALLASQVISAR